MKKLLVPLLFVGVFALAGCVSTSEAPGSGRDPRAMRRTLHSHLVLPVTGTFSVSYDPAQFTEAYDVRAVRHRNIATMMSVALERAGFKRTDQVPDYVVRYTYRTGPAFEGRGFRHAFDVTIARSRNATGEYADDLVWSGSAWIDRWPDQDITFLFAAFVNELFKTFPDPVTKDGT